MFKIIMLCVLGVVVLPVAMLLLSIPLAIVIGLLPWLLRVAGVVLLVKAILDKPLRWENFLPALGAFMLSWAIGWIF